MPFEVPKRTPKDLFQAMLARTAMGGPRRQHTVPAPGEGDPRLGPLEPLSWDPGEGQEGAYMRQPKPTAESRLTGSGGHMTESINSPRLKKKRAPGHEEQGERLVGAATHKARTPPWEED